MTLYFVSPYVPGLDALKSYVYLTPLIVLNISFISIKMYGGFSYYIENKTIYITYITLIALVTYIILAILLSRFGIMGITFSAAFVSIGSTYSFYYFSNKIKSFNENMNFILVLCIVSFFITSMLTVFMYNLT